MDAEQYEDEDLVDRELYSLVDALSPTEEALEQTLDLILGVIDELVEGGQIEDIPDEGASISEQQHWINNAMPIIKAEINNVLGVAAVPENQ